MFSVPHWKQTQKGLDFKKLLNLNSAFYCETTMPAAEESHGEFWTALKGPERYYWDK